MSTSHEPLRPSLDPDHRARAAARRGRARWLKRGIVVAVAAAVAVLLGRAFVPRPVEVELGLASRGTLAVWVEEDGRTRVRERFVVAAPVAGELRRVELATGDSVIEGQVVARIDPPRPFVLDARARAEGQARLAATLARQRQVAAAAVAARSARDLALRDAERAGRLEPLALSPADRERAQHVALAAAEDSAAADLARRVAAADVAAARAALAAPAGGGSGDGDVPVAAPVTGVVLAVTRESAGPVAAGAPLLEIGDPAALEVVVDVLSADAVKIMAGALVSIEGWGGERALRGRVTRVERAAFTRVSALGVEEQRVYVVIELEDAPPALGDGFRVEARIQIWEGRDVLMIPASALFRDGDGWAVFVEMDGKALRQPVTIGHRGVKDVEVLSGLGDEARVILYPGSRVTDGVSVVGR